MLAHHLVTGLPAGADVAGVALDGLSWERGGKRKGGGTCFGGLWKAVHFFLCVALPPEEGMGNKTQCLRWGSVSFSTLEEGGECLL